MLEKCKHQINNGPWRNFDSILAFLLTKKLKPKEVQELTLTHADPKPEPRTQLPNESPLYIIFSVSRSEMNLNIHKTILLTFLGGGWVLIYSV